MAEREPRASSSGKGGGDGRRTGGNGGEFRSGPVAGTALLDGVTFQRKPVLYAEVDGQAIVEGDIVIGSAEEMRRRAAGGPLPRSIGITGQQFRWPNGLVPYEIDPALPNQQRVTDAIAQWEASTPIRFVQRTPANAAQHPDFVRFVPGSGCSSSVGRQGGQQTITLGTNCTAGNAVHEIGHTVGLWHEQSRQDRDQFVSIVWANIDPAMQHNFSQHITDGDDLGAYDYGSMMHYPANAFTVNGQDTIVPLQALPAGTTMGQRSALSAGDIAGVLLLYPQLQPTIKEASKDPIQDPVTIKEVVKDPIQDTIKEAAKDPIRDTTRKELTKDPIQDIGTIKEAGKDPVQDTIKEAAFDPGPGPGPNPFQPFRGGTPFVLATPHQAPGLAAQQADPTGAGAATMALAQRLQEVGQALMLLEQDRALLSAEYNSLVAQLRGFGAG